ncbi:MAG: ADP-ribosylglycohydrolase family protein, partial [Planctomycetota bacterium]|nr:ADP-ribosylglycohydrolase family protein [Planctomycetota bacterium]
VTDDTELALGLARALVKDGANFDKVAQAYVTWCRSHPFDIGMTTQMALRQPGSLSSVTFDSVTRRASLTSQANGSVMRVSPLAIYGAFLEPSELADLARKDSQLTHPHPACQEASAAFSRAIAALIRGESREEAWLEALRSAYNKAGREHNILEVLKDAESKQPVCDAKNIGWVLIALQNAFYQLLNADSFEAGLVETVMAGGDTDTNGCIAGALLGAFYGEDAIPMSWRQTIVNCMTDRGADYQNGDARELAVELLKSGLFHHSRGLIINGGTGAKNAPIERPLATEIEEYNPLDDFAEEYLDEDSAEFDVDEDEVVEDDDDLWEEVERDDESDYAWELKVVVELAKECGQMLLAEAEREGGPRGSGDKADIDDEIDEVIHARLTEAFPDDTIISEEHGRKDGTSGRAFLVDPHDGTRDFLNGRRETSVSIGLVDHGKLVLGVVYAPFATEFTGPDGLLASWSEGEPLRRNGRIVMNLEHPVKLTESSRVLVSTRIQGEKLTRNREILAPAKVEHCASIATRLALVAVGDVDSALTLAHTLADWDFAAGQALIFGAGGNVVDPTGDIIRWRGLESDYEVCYGYFGARHVDLAADVASRYDAEFGLAERAKRDAEKPKQDD